MNVGGYFASLVLTTEKKSFDEGVAGVKSIGEAVKHVDENFGDFVKKSIAGLIALTAAAVGAGGAMTNIQANMIISAKIAGMNSEAYTNWGNAMKIATGSAEGLDAGAAKLQKTFTDMMIDKDGFNQLATNLALISRSLNINDIRGMSNSDRIKKILETALAGGDQGFEFSANRVGDILGPSFKTYLYALRDQKKTVAESLAGAAALRPTNHLSDQQVENNAAIFRKFTTQGEQIGKDALTAMLEGLTPLIKDLTKWLSDNKETIVNAFKDLGVVLGKILGLIGPVVSFLGKILGGALGDVANMSRIGDFTGQHPKTAMITEAFIKGLGFDNPGGLAELLDPGASAKGTQFRKIESLAFEMFENLAELKKPITAADESKVFGRNYPQVMTVNFQGHKFDLPATTLLVNYLKTHPGASLDDRNLAPAIMAVLYGSSQK